MSNELNELMKRAGILKEHAARQISEHEETEILNQVIEFLKGLENNQDVPLDVGMQAAKLAKQCNRLVADIFKAGW